MSLAEWLKKDAYKCAKHGNNHRKGKPSPRSEQSCLEFFLELPWLTLVAMSSEQELFTRAYGVYGGNSPYLADNVYRHHFTDIAANDVLPSSSHSLSSEHHYHEIGFTGTPTVEWPAI